MFTTAQINILENYLNEIKDDLLAHKKQTADGVWWPTPYYVNATEYAFEESYDIFNGNCGIALFFLALFRLDRDEAHLLLIDKIMHRILKSEAISKPRFFACYTGLGGVIYTCLKIFELTGKPEYLSSALQLTLTHQKQISEGLIKADLLSGYTGNLLVLTLLYHHSRNEEVLALINLLLDRLITEARVSKTGLKWDYHASKKAYDSMTGFSHGASGIAYVLMQLSQYFSTPGLLYLAEEALAYEMQYFNPPSKNWLDLRIGNYNLSKPDAHLWKLETFISDMTSVNAWAHGAAGVGISRIQAFNHTQKDIYLQQCEVVLERCLNDINQLKRSDFTVVSGYCGMIPFLLKYQKSFGINLTQPILSVFQAAEMECLQTKGYNGYVSCAANDYGLFSGKAGVGYMLLQCLLGDRTDFVTMPGLPLNIQSTLAEQFSEQQIKERIFSTYYKRTIGKIKTVKANVAIDYCRPGIDAFKITLKEQINRLSADKQETMDMYHQESELLEMWKQHKGYFSGQQRSLHLKKEAEIANAKTDNEFTKLSLKLNSHVQYYMDFENNGGLILISDESGIREMQVGLLSNIILKSFSHHTINVDELINRIACEYFEANVSKEMLRNKLMQQMRLMINSGLISAF